MDLRVKVNCQPLRVHILSQEAARRLGSAETPPECWDLQFRVGMHKGGDHCVLYEGQE